MATRAMKVDNMIKTFELITKIKIYKIGKIMNKLIYKIPLFKKQLKCKSAYWQKQKLKKQTI